MYTLYTSDTCPRGVMASHFLTKRSVEFTEVNLDHPANKNRIDQLWQLMRAWQEDPQAILKLPVLTLAGSASARSEEVVALGFQAREWEGIFSPVGQFGENKLGQPGMSQAGLINPNRAEQLGAVQSQINSNSTEGNK